MLPYHLPHWKSPDEKIILFNCHYDELFKLDIKFDLAITDPPYGIDAANDLRFGVVFKNAATKRKDYDVKDWDKNVPDESYFLNLFKKCKHQIIWGVNYYPYNFLAGGRIFWDKNTAEDYTNSDGELAFCSLINSIKKFKFTWNGMIQGDMKNKEIRIHPTQKPVYLYKWCLLKFSKPGYIILDTHLGSGSIAVAIDELNKSDDMNLTLIACELDSDIFKLAVNRIQQQVKKVYVNFNKSSDVDNNIQSGLFD